MSKLQRFNSFIGGLLTVFFGFALYMAPFMGVDMISFVMTAALLLMGIRNLHFYFTMSRHMVGGKYSLFSGIILTDLGVRPLMIKSSPPIYYDLSAFDPFFLWCNRYHGGFAGNET